MSFRKVAEEGQEQSSVRDLRVARVLADEGLKMLSQHRYEDASRIFNAGLKFSPTDARLHFLNGLSYHLLYLRGNEAMKDLGVAGYQLALDYDPANYYAALQLGRLQFDAKRYRESAQAFQRAIDIQPNSGDAYLGLAGAGYYAHDLGQARAAAEKASTLVPGNADAARASAMIYAALGNPAKAGEATARYAVLEQNAGARARLEARVDQWRLWHESDPSAKVVAGAVSKDALLAQLPSTTGRGADAPSPDSASKQPAAPPGTQPVEANVATQRAWFDCGVVSADQAQATYGGMPGADEIAPMPRLPAPCPGAGRPRMAVLDIAFIRTEDNASSSHGINLLDGMSYVFGLSRSVVDTLTTGDPAKADSRVVTITRQRSAGFPGNADGIAAGLTYSLNIANSTDNRSEILARPSLVALDRMPSTFFSGRNVTLGITGQAGGASSITDRPIGISLTVTPTFIDAQTLLLAVRAQRSFIEAIDLNVGFDKSLQVSRNAVSANVALKMGQTLILSGLSERETQRASSGVPVLKDIPVLQYLFNAQTKLDFTSSVLILITPHPPASDQQVMSKTIGHLDTLPDPEKRKFRPLIEKAMRETPAGIPGNLERTYVHAFGNTLFLQFRSGDLTIEHWSEAPRLEVFFRQLRELLYF